MALLWQRTCANFISKCYQSTSKKRLSKSQSAVEVTVLFSTAFLALGNFVFVLCITSECFWPICHLSPARFVCTLGMYFRRMAQCALIELCRALFSNLIMFCFNTCLSICLYPLWPQYFSNTRPRILGTVTSYCDSSVATRGFLGLGIWPHPSGAALWALPFWKELITFKRRYLEG